MSDTFKRQFNISSTLSSRAMDTLNEASYMNKSSMNNNYVSHLPEVYSGAPNRVERYNQYEAMDLDSHISASLDIISEFCTQVDPVSKIPFVVSYAEKPTQTETNIIEQMMKAWVNTNDFDNRLFEIVRNIIKYGDQFFIRDPQTYKWLWVYQGNVEKVIVNESAGKKPEQYVIRELDLNMQSLSVNQLSPNYGGSLPSIPGTSYSNISQNTKNASQGGSMSRFTNGANASAVDAEHVVHVNMNNGTDPNWPFGTSILEKVFKSYKQKELIEDAILIYRIQRAPQRRVFYIDVGDLPEHKAMAFVEQVKNSVSQRRIPSKTGGGANMLDASYNPISILDDFFFPQKPDGRGSRIDTLPGGETSWGTDELQYFDNKLARGLRVPSSYLPTGPDDSPSGYNDGKVGSALIQEFRFAEYCKRIQRSIARVFDQEFKLYLKKRDINVDSSLFTVTFVEPQSFVTWRQVELDTSRINNFNSMSDKPYISKRWAMERFLGLGKEEINKNNEMIMEENPSKFNDVNNIRNITDRAAPVDLRNVGFTKSDFDTDNETNLTDENPENPTPDTANNTPAAGGTGGGPANASPPAAPLNTPPGQ